MSTIDSGAKAWLEALARALEAGPGGGSVEDRILQFLAQIDARYRINDSLDREDQLPWAVFERLIEKLQPIAEAAASPALLAALRSAPDEVLGKSQLVDAVRARLLGQLDDLLASAPNDTWARVARGQLRLTAGDRDGAAEDFAAVVQRDAERWDARHGEIRALVEQRRDAEALARLDELLRLRPDDELGLFERARLRVRHDHMPEALADVDRLVPVAKGAEPLLFAAQQLLFVGRAADAAAICRRLPATAEALLVLGKALLDLGDPAAAVPALEGVLAEAQGKESLQRFVSAKVSALKLLGDAHAGRGDTPRALSRYVEAMAVVGTTYELERAVVKIAWDALHAGERGVPAGDASDAALAARWIETSMTAEFVDGRPVEVVSYDLALVPYLERLPWVDAVERLTLPSGPRDSRDGFFALFRLALPRLRQLDITAEHFGFPCLVRLVEAPFFARLEGLRLRQCDLGAPALQWLVGHVPRGLRELGVYTADARPQLPRAVALADQLAGLDLPELEALELHDCALVADEAIALTRARMPRLRLLGLTGNDLRGLDVGRFLDGALARQLRTLYVSDTGVELELVLAALDRVDGLALESVRAHRAWTADELRTVTSHPAYGRLAIDLGISQISDEAWLALLD